MLIANFLLLTLYHTQKIRYHYQGQTHLNVHHHHPLISIQASMKFVDSGLFRQLYALCEWYMQIPSCIDNKHIILLPEKTGMTLAVPGGE